MFEIEMSDRGPIAVAASLANAVMAGTP